VKEQHLLRNWKRPLLGEILFKVRVVEHYAWRNQAALQFLEGFYCFAIKGENCFDDNVLEIRPSSPLKTELSGLANLA